MAQLENLWITVNNEGVLRLERCMRKYMYLIHEYWNNPFEKVLWQMKSILCLITLGSMEMMCYSALKENSGIMEMQHQLCLPRVRVESEFFPPPLPTQGRPWLRRRDECCSCQIILIINSPVTDSDIGDNTEFPLWSLILLFLKWGNVNSKEVTQNSRLLLQSPVLSAYLNGTPPKRVSLHMIKMVPDNQGNESDWKDGIAFHNDAQAMVLLNPYQFPTRLASCRFVQHRLAAH